MPPIEMTVDLNVALLPAGHSAVGAARAEFSTDLRAEAELRRATRQVARDVAVEPPGTKGHWDDLVINLAGPTVVAAAVRALHLWLRRDRRRSVALTRRTTGDRHDGQQVTITIEGENLSEETVRRAIDALATGSPGAAVTDAARPPEQPPTADEPGPAASP